MTNVRMAMLRFLASRIPGGRHQCPICERNAWRFLPYARAGRAPLMTVLHVIGSDTTNFECPHCHSHDRERHLLLYMRTLRLFDSLHEMEILHFAPERELSKHIARLQPKKYVRCDLYPSTPDVERIDMLAMPFEDASFDAVIANHVLEHVNDFRVALSETVRVMRPGAWAILQTPYSARLQRTWEDSGIDDAGARLQAFGQEDHVRLFAKDVFDRFAECGLTPDVRTHDQVLPDIDPSIVGVNVKEPLFLFRKPC